MRIISPEKIEIQMYFELPLDDVSESIFLNLGMGRIVWTSSMLGDVLNYSSDTCDGWFSVQSSVEIAIIDIYHQVQNGI